MINWTLEAEDVEDAACTEDDMEARVVRNLWFEGGGVRGGGYKGTRTEMMEGHCGGAKLWRTRTRASGKIYGIIWSRCVALREAPRKSNGGGTVSQTTVLEYCTSCQRSTAIKHV